MSSELGGENQARLSRIPTAFKDVRTYKANPLATEALPEMMQLASSKSSPNQFTEAKLKDGTILRFKGQLAPDQIKSKVAAFRTKQRQSPSK